MANGCMICVSGMLKLGLGFWTRLVGPFKDPVEPAEDGVPDYADFDNPDEQDRFVPVVLPLTSIGVAAAAAWVAPA